MIPKNDRELNMLYTIWFIALWKWFVIFTFILTWYTDCMLFRKGHAPASMGSALEKRIAWSKSWVWKRSA